ncbi:MAG: hypothetical protein UX13_C0047G0010 [Candidatus Woesebacteria bacterium GW2011_GWB1_45_5]|uniref:Uncharacterized protein n=1 Tax=Candidatus Woesebacteria bacterium GW2011_GWB1_45_5 TaxID=1618581 RepID=A0A0G1MLI0_9BACT|nr:MAG: hypothetical protein UX13_C0047G0010 [Candidatus Woesebacteria bacterium GW2011_GWB1_45_5]
MSDFNNQQKYSNLIPYFKRVRGAQTKRSFPKSLTLILYTLSQNKSILET